MEEGHHKSKAEEDVRRAGSGWRFTVKGYVQSGPLDVEEIHANDKKERGGRGETPNS